MQTRDANEHPSHQLAKDGGQLQANHPFGHGPGGDEDHYKTAHLNEGFGHLMLVRTDLQQHLRNRQHHERA